MFKKLLEALTPKPAPPVPITYMDERSLRQLHWVPEQHQYHSPLYPNQALRYPPMIVTTVEDLEERDRKYMQYLETQHQRRMQEWEYYKSDEYLDTVAQRIHDSVHGGKTPPWMEEPEKVEPFEYEYLFEQDVDADTTVQGKHAGSEDDFEEVDGKHKE